MVTVSRILNLAVSVYGSWTLGLKFAAWFWPRWWAWKRARKS